MTKLPLNLEKAGKNSGFLVLARCLSGNTKNNTMRKDLFRDLNTEIREIFDLSRETSDFFVNIFNEVASKDKIVANVPGFSKDDLKITLDPNGYLKVSGEKEIEGETRRIQRSYFISPYLNGIDADKIEAKVENGVLVIKLSKKENAEKLPKEIKIQ